MRLIKAEIVSHLDSKDTRHSIYSLDFQPYGSRVATAGGDYKVRIWNAVSLLRSPEEAKESLLASLTNHTGSVNVVRWSKDGRYLASGGDDTYILVYRYNPKVASSFGTSGQCKEGWSRVLSLRGHSMDVLDIDWSPSGLLASASVDNKVIIWDCPSRLNASDFHAQSPFMSPMQVLQQGHRAFVKGLSFDPAGRYLASCGDDNVLILWDCQGQVQQGGAGRGVTWVESHRVEKPLEHSSDKMIFKRLSWAPDGSSLCLAAATKSRKPVGVVLRRGSWEPVADLVGHGADSMTSRFLPYVLEQASGSSSSPACVLALGDVAGVVSVWTSSRNRPVFVVREAVGSAVSDLAWTLLKAPPLLALPQTNHNELTAAATACVEELLPPLHAVLGFCSLDGFLVLVDFGASGDHGLGVPMDQASLDKHLMSMYGRSHSSLALGARDASLLVEDPSVLVYLQNGDQDGSQIGNGSGHSVNGLHSSFNGSIGAGADTGAGTASGSNSYGDAAVPLTAAQVLAMQKESKSRTKLGKKRICPVLLDDGSAPDVAAPDLSVIPSQGTGASGDIEAPVLSYAGSHGMNSINDGRGGAILKGNNNNSTSTSTSSTSTSDNRSEIRTTELQRKTQRIDAIQKRMDGLPILPSRRPVSNNNSSSTNNNFPSRASSVSEIVSSGIGSTSFSATSALMTVSFQRDVSVCTVPRPLRTPAAAAAVLSVRVQMDAPSPLPSLQFGGNARPNGSLGLDCGTGLSGMLGERGRQRGGAGESLLLQVSWMAPPPSLAGLGRLAGLGGMSSVCLLEAPHANGLGVESEGALLWSSAVDGEVCCASAICVIPDDAEFPPSSSASSVRQHRRDREGLVALGTVDGSLHLLSVACGARIAPPLVLGVPVAFLDVTCVRETEEAAATAERRYGQTATPAFLSVFSPAPSLPPSRSSAFSIRDALISHDGSSRGGGGVSFRVLVCTVEGEVCVWSVCGGHISSVLKTSLKPVMASMTCRAEAIASLPAASGTSSAAAEEKGSSGADVVRANVELCRLTNGWGGCPSVTVGVRSHGAAGGDFQAFVFSSDSACWVRVADTRYALSSLFAPLASTPRIHTDDHSSRGGDMATLQAIATASLVAPSSSSSSQEAHSSLDAVLAVARAKASSGNIDRLTPFGEANTWSNSITLAHVEDRLVVALTIGDQTDITHWLSEWVFLCAKAGLRERLLWLIERLLSGARAEAEIAEAAEAKDDRRNGIGGRRNGHSASHIHRTALVEVVLPALGRGGCMQSLLVDTQCALDTI